MLKRRIDRNSFITLESTGSVGDGIVKTYRDGKKVSERIHKIHLNGRGCILYKGERIYISEFEEVKV